MILLLALLPFFVSSTNLPQIDWSTCDLDKSFVTKCSDTSSNSNQLVEIFPDSKDRDKCRVGTQIRFFSENVALFQMQVIGEAKATYKLHLQFITNAKDLIGCELVEGKVKLVCDAETVKKHNIKLFEDRSHFEEDHALCAFTMEGVLAFSGIVNDRVQIVLNGDPSVSYPYTSTGNALFTKKSTRCDTYSMSDQSTSAGFKILPIKNIDKNSMNCDNYGPSFSLRHENATGHAVQIKELQCDATANLAIVANDGTPPQVLDDPEEYSFYCAAPFAEICQKPVCTDPNCPHFTPGERGKEAKLECDGSKWLIEDEYQVLERQPKCRQDTISNLNEAAFFVDLPSEKDVKLESDARCFVDYDCKKKSKLDYPRCKAGDANCGDLEFSEGKMQCKDKKRQLNVRFEDKTVTASSYRCNKSTGNWEDSKKFILPGGARVACIANKTRDVTVNLSPEQLYSIIGGSIAGCLGLAVLISLCIYCWYNPAAIFKVKNKHSWVRMSREGKIAYCKKKFAQIRRAASNTERIVHGLKLIELLIETETVENECWDKAFMFLNQVDGVLKRSEDSLARLFGRYLFLHAKKIIDNHGWTSPKPITNKKKHDKGLMRCVAIRLLAFSMDYYTEATMFVLSGFRQLGWEAVDQYPHCGLLWSVVPYANGGWIREKMSYVSFNSLQFTDNLHEIAFNSAITMPEEDVIPGIGSPSDQAAFALGGSAVFNYQIANAVDIIKEPKFAGGAKSFCKGMTAGLHHNPGAIMLTVFKSYSTAEEMKARNEAEKTGDGLVEGMQKVATESEWNAIFEHTLKIMLYYGRALDFKKLQNRFVPSSTHLMNLYNELHRNEKFFDESAHGQKEELRRWFAGRTDMDELKKKPMGTKDPAILAALMKAPEKKKKKEVPLPPPSSITKPADPPVDPFSDAPDSTKGTTPPASSTQSQKP